MIIRDIDGFEAVDAFLGQSVTTVVTAPGAPGSGIQSIPVVQLGPVQVMGRNGATIPQVIATIRTPSRVVTTVSAPSGLFQATIDQADLDAGAVIIFGASGYLSTTVQAVGLLCNRGIRNEANQIVQMSAQQCSFPVYYLDPVQATIPQNPYPSTYAPPAYGPAPAYYPPPGYPPAPQAYRSSWDTPVEERAPRGRAVRRRPMKDETVPTSPKAKPEDQAVPAPPAPVAPSGIYALTGGVNPWILAGGGIVAVGFLIWAIKS